MSRLIKKIIGSKNERDLKQIRPIVAKINEIEEAYQKLSEEELKAKSADFRSRLEQGETVDDILPEAFAAIKNACRRLVGTTYIVADAEREWVEVPYDVQLIGGIGMHRGMIAEMATGEGKTLVASLPAYLNALTGRGVHIVTVNDYLARRDAEWMGLLYNYLGVTVGCIQNQMRPEEKRIEYACDITYGTNSEFGFDYLRDNMSYRREEKVHRDYHYAIIDEIDSILIDEAKTPLIISGPAPHSSEGIFKEVKPVVQSLVGKQKMLIDGYIKEAKKFLEEEREVDASYLMYQIRQGMPKHKTFLAMLEDPAIRGLVEKVDGQMLTETYKNEARELREELYFTVDEKSNDASLTEKGCLAMNPNDPDMYVLPDIVEQMAILDGREDLGAEEEMQLRGEIQDSYAAKNETIHAVDQLIRAFTMYEKDVQYVVQNNQVMIVDENTGRLMSGRRWSDGLHQAIEAKEGVKIERETQTLATITIQNYFRLYEKLSGMTGTAETEADEFAEIYKLDVLVIPTNRPVRRVDKHDLIFRSEREKHNAVVEEIQAAHNRKQPILVGTVTVEASEKISKLLRKKNIPHNVLNAKEHAREADFIVRAGAPGAVTIATNMAGRGTDIKLGDGVVTIDRDYLDGQSSLTDTYKDGKTLLETLEENPCGLYVLGTERHESRRIDRQLRGRCSRQGDPGRSLFYVSLEDDLMRLFGSEKISNIMGKFGMEEGEAMEHAWLNKSIERAQRKVEEYNFNIRKRTLEYDDVMNQQREIVYGHRGNILSEEEVRPILYETIEEVIQDKADSLLSIPEDGAPEFIHWVNSMFPLGMKLDDIEEIKDNSEEVVKLVFDKVVTAYEMKVSLEDEEQYGELERFFMLQAIDTHWQEYLRAMDGLRQSVGLRAIGQKDPLVEFKHEAYEMFAELMSTIDNEICSRAFRSATSAEAIERFLTGMQGKEVHAETSAMDAAKQASGANKGEVVQEAIAKAAPIQREEPKVGRNEPCPCGSGKKYKKCHGA